MIEAIASQYTLGRIESACDCLPFKNFLLAYFLNNASCENRRLKIINHKLEDWLNLFLVVSSKT